MNLNKNPKSLSNNLVIQEFNDEILIYNTVTHKTFCLNQSSAVVFQLADGTKTVAEITNQLSQKLNKTINQEYVLLALDQLKKENLIENNFTFPNEFSNLSRREVIKRVGLTTMAVLPFISTLVAPTAAQSATGCLVSGQACTASSQCCSTNTTNIENPPGTVVATFTGSCCRNGSGPYGANNTCVPGNNGDFIPAGYVTWNGTTRGGGGTISCR